MQNPVEQVIAHPVLDQIVCVGLKVQLEGNEVVVTVARVEFAVASDPRAYLVYVSLVVGSFVCSIVIPYFDSVNTIRNRPLKNMMRREGWALLQVIVVVMRWRSI